MKLRGKVRFSNFYAGRLPHVSQVGARPGRPRSPRLPEGAEPMKCPHGSINCNPCNTSEAARELADLRSRLAAVEAERDENERELSLALRNLDVALARADAAEARVRDVETERGGMWGEASYKMLREQHELACSQVATLTRERDEARLAADNAEAESADAREELSGARDATDDAITETAKHDEDADALRAQLDEAVGLLRACPTTGHQPEDQTGEGGYDVCNWCGDVAGDCDADKTCWGAKARAFLSRLPASPGVGPTDNKENDRG